MGLEVRSRWSSPQEGRIVATVERDGERRTFDVPQLRRHRVEVALDPWPEHAREPTGDE